MADLKTAGIETLTLDVLSPESLSACVSEVQKLTGGTLDVLINNAGAGYNMPISDIQLSSAKQLFDLNVFSCIATIQAFLPLLLRANDGAHDRKQYLRRRRHRCPFPVQLYRLQSRTIDVH
jgi:1-acylglycerone phosphate reductase